MICIDTISKYCNEDISLIENYDLAIADNTQTWHCHHRFETELNITGKDLTEMGLYYDRPACELIFMTPHDHALLHNIHRKPVSKETKIKISNSLNNRSEEQKIEWKQKLSESKKGKTKSKEHKRKISESCKGRKHTSETIDKLKEYFKIHGSNIKGKHKVWDNKELNIYHFE